MKWNEKMKKAKNDLWLEKECPKKNKLYCRKEDASKI